jgi:predicted  nucleic acid-binding Zn-ribbon protein
MAEALDLLTLQSIDDEIASSRAALGEIGRRLEGDPGLLAAREELAELRSRRESLGRDQRRLEGSVADQTAHIEREERKLYDGSVKNPKELLSLQQEVEGLKAARARVEDELLEVLSEAETAAGEHGVAEATVARLEARWGTQSESLVQEGKRLEVLLTRLEARRLAEAPKVSAASLRMYDAIRARRGSAVAQMRGASCGGCRVAIPDALRRRAMAGSALVQCPNCERILAAG